MWPSTKGRTLGRKNLDSADVLFYAEGVRQFQPRVTPWEKAQPFFTKRRSEDPILRALDSVDVPGKPPSGVIRNDQYGWFDIFKDLPRRSICQDSQGPIGFRK